MKPVRSPSINIGQKSAQKEEEHLINYDRLNIQREIRIVLRQCFGLVCAKLATCAQQPLTIPARADDNVSFLHQHEQPRP